MIDNLRLKHVFTFTALVLMVPLIAMQFTEEVNWSLFDFLIGGMLLVIVGSLLNYILNKHMKKKHRLLLCAAIVFLFVLIWAELAVGIFNSRFAGT